MVAEVGVSAIGYFFPIFAFLLVFIIIYTVMKKTSVFGDAEPVLLFISFILSSFFIVEASLVDFVRFSSAWIVTGIFMVFFLLLVVAFVPGIELKAFFGNKNWFAWVLVVLVLGTFVISSAYIFNWAINWGMVTDWFYTDWFGMILLLVIAGVVSVILAKK